VVRPNGVSRGLLTVWRRQVAAAVLGKAPNFVPIQIGAGSGGETAESERTSPAQTKALEITAPSAKVYGGDRDRGERGANPRRARRGVGDAIDVAGGAPGHPVIALRSDLKVVLATRPVDFRKSLHTLSALVSEAPRAPVLMCRLWICSGSGLKARYCALILSAVAT
jgi:hypothetical protein